MTKLEKSKKVALKNEFRTIEHGTKLFNGSNLRHLMNLNDKKSIEKLNPYEDGNLSFCEISDSERWRVGLIYIYI